MAVHRTMAELEAGLDRIREAPRDRGVLELIACRPSVNQRRVLEWATFDARMGLEGDNWRARGHKRTADGLGHPDMQIAVMGSRVIRLVAESRHDWPIAGDQLYVDLDLSADNLPPGSRLQLGSAVLEVTSEPHTGCRKFVSRFGQAAMAFVNSAEGRRLNLRGIYLRVVEDGVAALGDLVTVVSRPPIA